MFLNNKICSLMRVEEFWHGTSKVEEGRRDKVVHEEGRGEDKASQARGLGEGEWQWAKGRLGRGRWCKGKFEGAKCSADLQQGGHDGEIGLRGGDVAVRGGMPSNEQMGLQASFLFCFFFLRLKKFFFIFNFNNQMVIFHFTGEFNQY